MKKTFKIAQIVLVFLFFGTGEVAAQLHWFVDSVAGSTGSQIVVPVRANSFSGVASMQGTIAFDAAVVSFAGVEQFSLAGLGTGNFGTTNVSAGQLTFSWFDSDLSGETLADSTVIWAVRFNLIGSFGENSTIYFDNTPTPLEFIDASFTPILTTYDTGFVAITGVNSTGLTLAIDSVATFQNNIISVPVRASNFQNILGLQGTIGWDASVANFAGVDSFGLAGLDITDFGTTQTTAGKLTFAWADVGTSGQTIADSTVLFAVNLFALGNSGASTQIGFLGSPTPMEVVDSSLNLINPLLQGGELKILSDTNQLFSLLIDSVIGMETQKVLVPIRAQQFTDINSIQGTFLFDTTVIKYANVKYFNLPNMDITNFGTNFISEGKLNFSWFDADLTGETIADSASLFSLEFDVVGQIGDWGKIKLINTPTPIEYTNTSLNPISYVLDSGGVKVDSSSFQITIVNNLNASYCIGDSILAQFISNVPVDSTNNYTLELSNASGSFNTYTTLATLNSGLDTGIITGFLPYTIEGGTTYRVRISSSAPTVFNGDDNGVNIAMTIYKDTVTNSICLGDSILLGGIYQSTNGIYSDTLVAMDGCDSLVYTQLTVTSLIITNDSITICAGDSTFLQGAFQTTTGIYQDTLVAVGGCDSLSIIELNVLPNAFDSVGATICSGDSIFLQNAYQFTNGLYSDTLIATNGCDSVITTSLSLFSVDTTFLAVEICESDSILLAGSYQTISGNYLAVFTSINGCDSIVLNALTVLPNANSTQFDTICAGDSVLLAGVYQYTVGVYYDTLTANNTCDSVITTNLWVLPVYLNSDTLEICAGDSALIFGMYYFQDTLVRNSLQTVVGCDSILEKIVLVHPTYSDTQQVQICIGDSIFLAGNWQNSDGIFVDSLSSLYGCDSVVISQLLALTSIENPVDITVCFGDSAYLGGFWQDAAGIYYDTLTASAGCDSVVVSNFNFYPLDTVSATALICFGDSMLFSGVWQTTTGIYSDTLTNTNGCDSIVFTELLIEGPFSNNDSLTICWGDSALLGGIYQTATGIYYDTLTSINGCDSIIQWSLVALTPTTTVDSMLICAGDSVYLENNWQNTSGIYIDTLSSQLGCDSIIEMQLTIVSEILNNQMLEICADDSLFLQGNYQTTNGIYYDTLVAQAGCDSILISDLNIVIIPDSYDTLSKCISDSVFVQNMWQTTNGTYVDTLSSALGCDSIAYQTLSFVNSLLSLQEVSICDSDSIFLAGNWQNNTGVYYDTLTALAGCDSVIETSLFVYPTYLIANISEICDGDSLLIEGTWQTTPGLYTATLTSISGCDSIIETSLLVNPIFSSTATETICQGDSILIGGTYQTITGAYTNTLTTNNGCDSIIEVNLTVYPVLSSSNMIEICEGDSALIAGAYQTNAGNYTENYTSINGCDSIVTINLIVHPKTNTPVQFAVCEGDSAFLAGNYQTNTGSYVDSLISINGCDSLITTELTIIPTVNGSSQLTICNGDSIFLENAYQTTAGVYIDTLATTQGCDSIVKTTLSVYFVAIAIAVDVNELTANTTGTETFQWLDCDANFAPIAGEISNVFVASQTGTYAVAITDQTCKDTSSCNTVVISSITELNTPKFKVNIHPNPVKDNLTITTNLSVFNVEITDVYGRVVQTKKANNSVENINFSDLPNGLYFIKISSKKGVKIMKVEKVK